MENYNYLMEEFYGEDEKICEIYHNLEEIGDKIFYKGKKCLKSYQKKK